MTAPIFSAESLQSLRALNRGSLVSRARIDRPRITSQGGGANTGGRAWTTVADVVPCRMAPLVPSVDGTQADENTNTGRWVVVFDVAGDAITEGDRLTVTGTDVTGAGWTRQVIVIGRHFPRTFSAMRSFACADVGPGMTGAPT